MFGAIYPQDMKGGRLMDTRASQRCENWLPLLWAPFMKFGRTICTSSVSFWKHPVTCYCLAQASKQRFKLYALIFNISHVTAEVNRGAGFSISLGLGPLHRFRLPQQVAAMCVWMLLLELAEWLFPMSRYFAVCIVCNSERSASSSLSNLQYNYV